jgi:Leucine-rich repeat (LRR) protein
MTNINKIIINTLYLLDNININDYMCVINVDLTGYEFEKIPNTIFNFNNLQLLQLSNVFLNKVSKKIGLLSNLEELYLTRNKIKELPEEIGNLKKLRVCILSNNQITNLPKNFYNLCNLELLNLSMNHLEIINDDIEKLKKLDFLYLRNNKLKYIPKSIKYIKTIHIFDNSYENINNLSFECEYLQINNLNIELKNLPSSIKEIRLYLPMKIDITLPFDCKLFIDDFVIN